ncbi:hypothetical protein A2U01_0034939, partial [Trifolium medium]|nr:hypothetical protein [Trifolium medium]
MCIRDSSGVIAMIEKIQASSLKLKDKQIRASSLIEKVSRFGNHRLYHRLDLEDKQIQASSLRSK